MHAQLHQRNEHSHKQAQAQERTLETQTRTILHVNALRNERIQWNAAELHREGASKEREKKRTKREKQRERERVRKRESEGGGRTRGTECARAVREQYAQTFVATGMHTRM